MIYCFFSISSKEPEFTGIDLYISAFVISHVRTLRCTDILLKFLSGNSLPFRHMKEKILLISPQPFFQWRGSPIRVAFNVLALTELGYNVDLLTLPIGEKRKIAGVNVIRVANPLGLKNIPIGPSLPKIFFDLLLLLKGISLCLKNQYNVVHGIEEAGFIGVILARLIGARAIFEKHSDPFSYKKGKLRNLILRLYAGVEKLSVKMSDAVICTGPGLVQQVDAMGTSTRASHVSDIPSSLVEFEEGEAAAVRRKLKKSQDEVLVSFVGSFALYQGVDLMFAAIPLVIEKCPQSRFIIIGGSTKEIEEQKNKFRELGVEGQVSFLGKVSPDVLPNYLRASDILLSPRASGVNSPLKVLDYMKAGRSIVATDIPSNRLLLNENNAALTRPVPDGFSQGIIAMVEDKQRRQEMGKANYDLYKSKYNFDNYCEQLGSCYSSLLNNSHHFQICVDTKRHKKLFSKSARARFQQNVILPLFMATEDCIQFELIEILLL